MLDLGNRQSFTLNITPEIIEAATKHRGLPLHENGEKEPYTAAYHCVTARATAAALGLELGRIHMASRTWDVLEGFLVSGGTYKLPKAVRDVQTKFDNGQPVEPTKIRVRIRKVT